MKTKIPFQEAIIGATLMIAIIFAGYFFFAKTKLKSQLSDEKLKTEMLLSEKLRLDKTISKYQVDVSDLKFKTSNLSNSIADANLRIIQKNEEISRLKANFVSAKELQKKNAELETLKLQLSQEIEKMNRSLADAKSENLKLNNLLAESARANENLSSDNSLLKALFSDNYRTEATRGKNDRLTINAKRTQKLMVSFDLPGNISNEIYFKVVTPSGKELSSNKDLAAEMNITEYGDALLASISENAIGGAGTKRVELSYKPNKKLSKGIYQFNLYNKDRLLGSTQLRLK